MVVLLSLNQHERQNDEQTTMSFDSNSKQRQREAELDRRMKAMSRWQESEWVLGCLRSKTGTPLKELNDDQIVDWHRRIQQQ